MPRPVDEFADGLVALQPKLLAHALRLTRNRTSADDLIQDTICRCLEARNQFKPGTNLSAWSYMVMRNLYYTHIRRVRHHMETQGPEGCELLMPGPDRPDARLELEQAIAVLNQANHRHAEITIKAALGGTIEELAAEYDIPEGTVKSSISRGRAYIKHLR